MCLLSFGTLDYFNEQETLLNCPAKRDDAAMKRESEDQRGPAGKTRKTMGIQVTQGEGKGQISLDCLGTEIITHILDMLNHDSPHTLSSVALVSKFYHKVARYSQSRILLVNAAESSNDVEKQWGFVRRKGLLPAVRRLSISRANTRVENGPTQQPGPDFVAELIQSIPGLQDVDWEGSGVVPIEIITALRERPAVRLHTELSLRTYGRRDIKKIEDIFRLVDCPNLSTLKVRFISLTDKHRREFSKAVKSVLLSCPNIKSLKIDIGVPTSGCMAAAGTSYTGFGFVGSERPPALEELELDRYEFGWEEYGSAPKWGGPFVSYPGKGREMDHWVNVFDWSKLKRLRSTDIPFANSIAPKLSALEAVSLQKERGIIDLAVAEFCRQVAASLKGIEIEGLTSRCLPSILRHGPTLQKLVIHQLEKRVCDPPGGMGPEEEAAWREEAPWRKQVPWREEAPSATLLAEISEGCPRLEELSLDVGRQGQWPFEIFDVLACFPNLKTLKIWFELGSKSRIVEPVVTFSAAREIFAYIQRQRPEGLPQLRELTVMSGCPRSIGLGRPSRDAYWPQDNSLNFICKLSERDDEAGRGMFTVRCPTLSDEANRALARGDRKLLQGEEGRRQLLARDGATIPTPYTGPLPRFATTVRLSQLSNRAQ